MKRPLLGGLHINQPVAKLSQKMRIIHACGWLCWHKSFLGILFLSLCFITLFELFCATVEQQPGLHTLEQ